MKTDGSGNRNIKQDEMQHKAFTSDIAKSINEEKRTIDFVISNETPDRHGDVVSVKGWNFENFMENPVVLFAHSRGVPPIGKALKVWKSGGNLNATAQFMSKEISPFADSIFQMFKEGFLKAVSVGFMPEEFEFIRDDDNDFITGIKFLKQELLEFSAVPVPSNPDALMKARTKGIDVEPFGKWAEDMLDDWANSSNMIRETYNIGKKQIELIRRKAIGETMTYQVPESKQKELLEKNLKAAEAHRAKEKDDNDGGTVFKLNRSAVAYANSLIEKDGIDLNNNIEGASTKTKEHLAISDDKQKSICQIIKDDNLYRSAVVIAKKDSAFDDDTDVFNAASKLLKKIDGEETFKSNEYENWDKDIPIKDFDPKDYEELDVIQHQDGNVTSTFFNNAPKELIIQESLFKSSGGAVGFTGESDNVSIVFNGSNIDLKYYPYAKDSTGSFVCKLDSDITSVPNVTKVGTIEIDMRVSKESEEAYKEEIKGEVGKEIIDDSTIEKDEIDTTPKTNSNDVEDQIKMTPMEQISCLDQILIDIEETLENDPNLIDDNIGDKRFIRKIKFVAEYMKEIAELVSPSIKSQTNKIIETKPDNVIVEDEKGETDGITEKDIDDYIIKNLGPTLDKIVQKNLKKLRGQLD